LARLSKYSRTRSATIAFAARDRHRGALRNQVDILPT
jgi:hypothetical protein